MKEFDVCITEVLDKHISVKAKSKEEAYETVLKQYADEEIVLDYNDFSYYEIEVVDNKIVESEENNGKY